MVRYFLHFGGFSLHAKLPIHMNEWKHDLHIENFNCSTDNRLLAFTFCVLSLIRKNTNRTAELHCIRMCLYRPGATLLPPFQTHENNMSISKLDYVDGFGGSLERYLLRWWYWTECSIRGCEGPGNQLASCCLAYPAEVIDNRLLLSVCTLQ